MENLKLSTTEKILDIPLEYSCISFDFSEKIKKIKEESERQINELEIMQRSQHELIRIYDQQKENIRKCAIKLGLHPTTFSINEKHITISFESIGNKFKPVQFEGYTRDGNARNETKRNKKADMIKKAFQSIELDVYVNEFSLESSNNDPFLYLHIIFRLMNK